MNILVLTSSGKVIMRPDTSWERLNDDFFVPDFVQGLKFSPVFFARISRPGKAIGQRFVSRYYDALGLGLLLYPANFLDGSPEGFASACCLTHSSYLPIQMLDKESFSSPSFRISKDSEELFRGCGYGLEMVEKAISRVTEISLVRKGDLVAVELDCLKNLVAAGETAKIVLSSSWFGDSEFQII